MLASSLRYLLAAYLTLTSLLVRASEPTVGCAQQMLCVAGNHQGAVSGTGVRSESAATTVPGTAAHCAGRRA